MTRKAKVGMIGLRGYGNIVRRALRECHTLELAAIWSRSPEAIERSQRELPSKVCPTYEALLDEPIDAVLIITPNDLHLPYAVQAAEAGKAVLVEKPMTNTVAEARAMIEAFRRHGRLLGVKHVARFSAVNRAIRNLITSGRLGLVLSVEAYTSHSSSKQFPKDRWKSDPKRCPVAPLTQLGVHHIDTLMSFFGSPQWVQSIHMNRLQLSDNPDATVTVLGYGDVVSTLHAHYVVPGYSRLAVYGTEGVAVHDESGLRWKAEGAEDVEAIPVPSDDGLVAILDAFGESLLTGKPFETDGESGRIVVAAVEAAARSAREEGRRVFLSEVLT